MEGSSNDDAVIEPTTQQQPKMHDRGHDNKVFADETGIPHLNRPANNHYNHANGHYNNGHPPQSFRILENSRL